VITLALIVGGATLVVGVALAVLLRRLPSVRLQLTGLAMLAVALPLASVTLSGLVVFHMGAEAGVLLVSAAAAATSLVGAILLARYIVFHLERVRDASHELASGDLGARAPEGGPAEVAELAASFNAMAGHLEEVFDARRELVAWASHDLRAPITSLQAMLEAMEDGIVEPQHYLETLQGQVRLLGSLVDDLFEMACIDSGAITLAVEPVDLGGLVHGFLQHYELEAQARGLRVRTVVRDDATWALCAPDKVERVLTNLVTNALRHTPAGGLVMASVASGAGAVFVSLEDSGPGVADEERERIFEPFWRGDAARVPSGGGAGLGLAIARGLIDAQNGRIWAETPTRGGTRICFALPAAPSGSTATEGSFELTRAHAESQVTTVPD
jgi:two-component system OmpR family sensor kinase/two-component system sensor histidine kinase BaeS